MRWGFDMNRPRTRFPEDQKHPAWWWIALGIILCVFVAGWLVSLRMAELTDAVRGSDAVEKVRQ